METNDFLVLNSDFIFSLSNKIYVILYPKHPNIRITIELIENKMWIIRLIAGLKNNLYGTQKAIDTRELHILLNDYNYQDKVIDTICQEFIHY